MELTEGVHGAEYRQESDLESEGTTHKLMNIVKYSLFKGNSPEYVLLSKTRMYSPSTFSSG